MIRGGKVDKRLFDVTGLIEQGPDDGGRDTLPLIFDGGYDPGHPDLQGKVLEVKDFTGSGVKATLGHGTHVAATVVGDGAFGGVAKFVQHWPRPVRRTLRTRSSSAGPT